MSAKKAASSKKLRLDDATEGVTPPWQAWWHPEKKRKFYTNKITKESVWDHPKNLKNEKERDTFRIPRKRRDNEKPDDADVMEVDVEPPVKRRLHKEEEEDVVEGKRRRTECASTEVFPTVSWSSTPYFRYPYKAVAIFDTSSLIQNYNVLDMAVKHYILSVIPYTVLTEVDGLKHDPEARTAAMHVTRRIKELGSSDPYFIRLETSSEGKIEIPNYVQDKSVKDDAILKCALRTQMEVLSIASQLSPELTANSILFVTDDVALSNKAAAHRLVSEPVEKFIATIYGTTVEKKKEKEKSPRTPKTPKIPKNIIQNRNSIESSGTLQPRQNYNHFGTPKRVKALKEQRELQEWIGNMTTPSAPKSSPMPSSTPSSRPAIPLIDEVEPRELRPKTYRAVPAPRPSLAFKNPTVPSRPRPKMPLSLSDEEEVEGSEMDCS